MTEAGDTQERGGMYYAYCDIDGRKLGSATSDRAEAERIAKAHQRDTDHATSVLTL